MIEIIGEFLGLAFPYAILAVMLVGLFGLVVPIFPGGVVIWAAALVYGLVMGFEGSGIWFFAFITLLMFASTSADNILMGAKALDEGASWRGIIIGLAAGFVTSLFFTPLAGLIAAPFSLYVTEYFRLKDSEKAFQITRGLMIGCGWAFIVRFVLGALKIGLYAWWAFG